MAKYTDDGRLIGYTTDDIVSLGISRELNSKYERDKYLPKATIEPAAGPWRAAIYSKGDLIARLLMKRLTGRGLALNVASWILYRKDFVPGYSNFIGRAFDEGELDEFKFMAFPVPDKGELDPKADSNSQPFNKWSELDFFYNDSNHDAFIVLDIESIRNEVKQLE